MDLDVDPYEIDSWEEYCKDCIKARRIDLFKSKLGSHLSMTNKPIKKEIEAFCIKVQGEIKAYELLQQHVHLKKGSSKRKL